MKSRCDCRGGQKDALTGVSPAGSRLTRGKCGGENARVCRIAGARRHRD